ncbi:MAG: sulfotransferase [Gammaproteobacteria bacterium]
MKRIHIVGASPRTGTTLLTEAMIACFAIDLHVAHEARIFVEPPRPAQVFLTKCPRDILVAERFLARWPELYVIYMLRDPRNVITSRHGSAPDVYWAGLKFWNTYTPYGRRLADHPRFVTLRYEDLVSDPDAVQRTLETRLPFLERTAPFSRYHELAQPTAQAATALGGVRAMRGARPDRWRDHLPRVAGQIELHGKAFVQDLIELGYETDDAWLAALEGVTPDTRPGRWPEFFDAAALARVMQTP